MKSSIRFHIARAKDAVKFERFAFRVQLTRISRVEELIRVWEAYASNGLAHLGNEVEGLHHESGAGEVTLLRVESDWSASK